MSKYDTDQALDVFSAFAATADKNGVFEERQRAAVELLAEVAALSEKAVGIRSGKGNPGQLAAWVAIGDATAAVIYQGSTFYVQAGNEHLTVPLVFNRRLQAFQGAVLEDPAVPPGQPKPRRDALVEIAMHAVALLVKTQ